MLTLSMVTVLTDKEDEVIGVLERMKLFTWVHCC